MTEIPENENGLIVSRANNDSISIWDTSLYIVPGPVCGQRDSMLCCKSDSFSHYGNNNVQNNRDAELNKLFKEIEEFTNTYGITEGEKKDLQEKLKVIEQYEFDTIKDVNVEIEQNKSETHDSGFTKLSGAASILGLFFTFFFRFKDIKQRRKEREEQEDPLKPIDMKLWDADLSDSDNDDDNKKADLTIDEKTYDNGYETTLTIRNNSKAEAKNVMVEVLPDKEQNLTNARIVNAEILPKEIVYPKGSFQVTVECWYPKAYRDVVVTWEDTKPRKIVQNVQLSKNYVV